MSPSPKPTFALVGSGHSRFDFVGLNRTDCPEKNFLELANLADKMQTRAYKMWESFGLIPGPAVAAVSCSQ